MMLLHVFLLGGESDDFIDGHLGYLAGGRNLRLGSHWMLIDVTACQVRLRESMIAIELLDAASPRAQIMSTAPRHFLIV